MLLGKLCERKDKTALLMCMHTAQHSDAVLLFETRKLIYKNNTHNITSTTHPICPFICGKPIEFATFSRTVLITPVNNTKHQFPYHRKFVKHRVKRDLG